MDLTRFNTAAQSNLDLIAQVMPGDRVFTARDNEFFRPSSIEVENVKTVSKTMFTTTAGNSYMRRTGVKRGEGDFRIPRHVITYGTAAARRRSAMPWEVGDVFSKNALLAVNLLMEESPEERHARESTRHAAYLDAHESWRYELTDQPVTLKHFSFLVRILDHVAGDPEGHRRVYYLGENNVQVVRDVLAALAGPVRCGNCGLRACHTTDDGSPLLFQCADAPRVDEEEGLRVLDMFRDRYGFVLPDHVLTR